MRRIIALLLICSFVFSGCSNSDSIETTSMKQNSTEKNEMDVAEENTSSEMINKETSDIIIDNKDMVYNDISDPKFLEYIEDTLSFELKNNLDDEIYTLEDIETVFYSKEYLEELEYNTQSNIYFGYTLDDIDKKFEGERYVFTLGEDGKTTIIPFEEYDDTFDGVLKAVAIGSGVFFLCATVKVAASAGAVTAMSKVKTMFVVVKEKNVVRILSAGLLNGVVEGINSGEIEAVVKATAVGAIKKIVN